ncbi:threonine-rich protein isoform X3 [Agrilus planipennis]|uniref:Threonine-rich protein isoform X3 n=1 Tax=Agrilus planipennis TaxID=224129 RepID=A0A1W4WA74_AGRPL|nr:threonine-rich protein isoform X3 [Agrilus planipennis]
MNTFIGFVFISTLLGTCVVSNGDENVTTTISTEVTIANVTTEVPTTSINTTPGTTQAVTTNKPPEPHTSDVPHTTDTPVTAGTTQVVTTNKPPVTTEVPPTTEVPHTSEVPVTTSTPQHGRHFDGPSFIGGIVLASGLMAIGFVAFKFYKARTERNYHTL